MPLIAPHLDDRTFQDLVDECKRLIPRYCPEWTDHNVSDPGIALIELFAWLTETMLYRLNQVPDKQYVKFMELIGLRLQPPSPARAEITLWLSAPLHARERAISISVPPETQVATIRTETSEALVFSTEQALTMVPATLITCQGHPVGQLPRQHLDDLRYPRIPGQGIHIFSDIPIAADRGADYEADHDRPQPGDAFYLGFAEDLSRNLINLHLDLREAMNIGVVPSNPPRIWEAWVGYPAGWVELELAREDTTGGLTGPGDVALYLPPNLASGSFANQEARAWIRCRVTEPPPGPARNQYSQSPELLSLDITTVGGTAVAGHREVVVAEELGVSDGTPEQVFQLRHTPILARGEGEVIEIENDAGDFEPWQEVDSFWPAAAVCPTCGQGRPHRHSQASPSSPTDRWYTLDEMTGEIRFGPLVREPDGSARQCGAIPPKGKRIRMARYSHGGGAGGNVGPNTIVILKQALPYLSPEVTNRQPATGGADAESLERARLRAPQVIRTRDRAVTPGDFELLARIASSSVARAKCLQMASHAGVDPASAGQVTVLLVPAVERADGPLAPAQLELDTTVKESVTRYLDDRRLLTTTLIVDSAPAVGISLEVKVQIVPTADPERIRGEIERELYTFLHPTLGWTDGRGWPFGRDLTTYDLYGIIHKVVGVLFITGLTIYRLNREGEKTTTETLTDPTKPLSVPPGAVLYSGRHTVLVERASVVAAASGSEEP